MGSKLYTHTRFGRPVLLKREIIATGDQLTNATRRRRHRKVSASA